MIKGNFSMKNLDFFTKIFFLIIIFLLFWFFKSQAAGSIIINEIMYDLEGADNDMEWIELKNISSEPVDLSGWKFNDGSNHLLNPPPKNGGQGSMIVPPEGFAILADKADLFLQTHPNFSGIVIDTVMSLNNTAATLKLIDKNGNVVEEVSYNKNQGGNGNGFSLERISDSVPDFCESNVLGGTPGEQNNFNCQKVNSSISPSQQPTPVNTPLSTPVAQIEENEKEENLTPPPTSNNIIKVRIIINEFLPNPVGNDEEGEWIELYNDSETDVPLKGWRLEDASGQKYSFKDEVIKAKDFLVLPYKTTKITLNNSNETLTLFSPNNEMAFKISYIGKAEEGFSYARIGPNNWQWTSILTPGKPNQFENAQANNQKNFEVDSIVEGNLTKNQSSVDLPTSQANNYSQKQTNNFSDKIIIMIFGIGLVFSVATAIFIKKILP